MFDAKTPSNRRRFLAIVFALPIAAAALTSCSESEDTILVAESAPEVPKIEFTSWEEAITKIRADHKGESITPDSSSIQRAEYFPADGKGYLLVQFTTNPGHEFLYAGVPEVVWNDFKAAASKGGFFNNEIRGKYEVELKGSGNL